LRESAISWAASGAAGERKTGYNRPRVGRGSGGVANAAQDSAAEDPGSGPCGHRRGLNDGAALPVFPKTRPTDEQNGVATAECRGCRPRLSRSTYSMGTHRSAKWTHSDPAAPRCRWHQHRHGTLAHVAQDGEHTSTDRFRGGDHRDLQRGTRLGSVGTIIPLRLQRRRLDSRCGSGNDLALRMPLVIRRPTTRQTRRENA